MGEVYHPYIETGVKQDSDRVSERLESCFDRINQGLKIYRVHAKKRIDKAHRVVKKLVSTIAFFFCMIEVYMDNVQLSDDEKKLMHQYLIPGFCLLPRKSVTLKKGAYLKKISRITLRIRGTQRSLFRLFRN